jgi:hypothetical protein
MSGSWNGGTGWCGCELTFAPGGRSGDCARLTFRRCRGFGATLPVVEEDEWVVESFCEPGGERRCSFRMGLRRQ